MKDGDLQVSIVRNAKRFNMTAQLALILMNTAELLEDS